VEEGTEERDEDEDAADDNVALALDLEQVVGAEGVVGLVGAGPITCRSKKGERNAQPVQEGTSVRQREQHRSYADRGLSLAWNDHKLRGTNVTTTV